jgi:hypothetical protein
VGRDAGFGGAAAGVDGDADVPAGGGSAMPQRIFTDPAGVRWVVWDVYPGESELASLRERRTSDDRRADLPRGPVLERRLTDRRTRVRASGHAFAPGYETGWLVFRDVANKVVRRLAPTPDDWETCDDATLEAYRQLASPSRELLGAMGAPVLSDRLRITHPLRRQGDPRPDADDGGR